jgi:photosystem II stability/assembly factor-like uncharacterized protein
LHAISCPSATTCFAGGDFGAIVGTETSGSSWTTQPWVTTYSVQGISCPTTTVCFQVDNGGEIAATTNGGATWSRVFSTAQSLNGVNCANPVTCIVVGLNGTIIATNDSGATWSSRSSGTTENLTAISCPDTNTCFAVGANGTVVATSNGGMLWSAQSSGDLGNELTGISCASTPHCVAVDAEGRAISTSSGGSSWQVTPVRVAPALAFSNVSCATTKFCIAVSNNTTDNVFATDDGGSSWVPAGSLTGGVSGISCSTSEAFVAVGFLGAIFTTSDRGAQWKSEQLSALPNYAGKHLTTTSCPTVDTCYAVGEDGSVIATSDGGATWKRQYSTGNRPLNGISCPVTTACIAVGGVGTQAIIVATTDSGRSWTEQTSPTGLLLTGVSCPSITTCYAVGGSFNLKEPVIIGTTNSGTTWTVLIVGNNQTLPVVTIYDITCTSQSSCFAVGSFSSPTQFGGAILYTTDGWTNVALQGPYLNPLTSGGCSSITNCLTVGGQTVLTTADGGASWSVQPLLSDFLQGVSCVSSVLPATCSAVTSHATVLTTSTNGSSWVQEAQTDVGLLGIACPGDISFIGPSIIRENYRCVAVGDNGTILSKVVDRTFINRPQPVSSADESSKGP